MKNTVKILFIFLFLLVNTGVSIARHFCCSETAPVKSSTEVSAHSGCCSEEPPAPKEEPADKCCSTEEPVKQETKSSGCCHDDNDHTKCQTEITTIQINDYYGNETTRTNYSGDFASVILSESAHITGPEHFTSLSFEILNYTDTSPIYLDNCNFRI